MTGEQLARHRAKTWCRVDSFDDLERYQSAILERIAGLKHGGNLFLLHPFKLLEDLGVALSDPFKQLLIGERPALATLSELPYAALWGQPHAEQTIEVRMTGLFQRGGHSHGRKK
jgi:hypothetical protein